jgi:hypothetical protein
MSDGARWIDASKIGDRNQKQQKMSKYQMLKLSSPGANQATNASNRPVYGVTQLRTVTAPPFLGGATSIIFGTDL